MVIDDYLAEQVRIVRDLTDETLAFQQCWEILRRLTTYNRINPEALELINNYALTHHQQRYINTFLPAMERWLQRYDLDENGIWQRKKAK